MSQNRPPRPKSRIDFEIAIICALTIEANAVLALFDHHWEEDEDSKSFGKARGDPNAYSTGVIGQHNVVLAHLPGMGKVAAGNIAAFCRMSYPEISLALVVGICGGVPFYGKANEEILLGDVIVSTGVVQYDLGKRFPDKFRTKDTLEDNLGRPGLELRSLFSKLQTNRQQGKLQITTQKHLQKALEETKILGDHLEGLQDNLFPADYRHKHQDPSDCTICAACNGMSDPVCDVALGSSCKDLNCDVQQRVSRERLYGVENDNEETSVGPNSETLFPAIHYGTFASGDMVIKSAEYRDQLAASKDAIGFEMESVGVWEVFPCVVIKGVSDYADSHKNDDWHDFAVASAAACMKAFLKYWDSSKRGEKSETGQQKLRETVINSLRFTEINERRNDLDLPAPTTFEWVLETCSEDSDTQSCASDHEEAIPDQEDKKVQNQDQVGCPMDEESHNLQGEDSSGDFQGADDRSQISLSDYSVDSDDDSEDDSDGEDEFVGFSHSGIQWDAFTDWLASYKPCYWISGNPGSGKSTLMRHLSQSRKTSEYLAKWRKGTVILSHFFWKPGTRMQQSFKGLLCSLLCELSSKSPEAVQMVHDMKTKGQRLSPTDWSQQELSNILLQYCKYSSQPICLFLDGLDEALPGQDVLNILQFLKSLTSLNANVKICVSSRPERVFRLHFKTFPSLKMHELTKLDIARYSRNAMVELTLLKPRGQKLHNLARQIASLSDGIFLWAVLVTQSLIRGINNGDSSDQTSKRLQAMPANLMDLYNDILSRLSPDRSIYERDVSIILNLLFLAPPAEVIWPTTPFMLTMAMNPDILGKYVDRGDNLRQRKFESKVKNMKDMLEAAFAGLVQVKYRNLPPGDPRDIIEQVSFPHRSAKDFLLDTTEGRALWQPCEIPQEELLARCFKSLLADSRLFSENSDSELSFGVSIRPLLSVMFEWEEKHSCPQGIIVSFLELARICFHRGHLQDRDELSLELNPVRTGDQFLLHAASNAKLSHIRYLLDEHETTTPEGMYCLLLFLCDAGFLRTQVMQIIEYILGQGYSPNWSTVYQPTGDRHLVASPWFMFLIHLLSFPENFFPERPEAERGQLVSEAFQMFLKSGASLEAIFPVVVQVTATTLNVLLARDTGIIYPELDQQCLVMEVNARAVIYLISRTTTFAELRLNVEVQPDCLPSGSYINVLAFNEGGRSSLSVIKDQMISDRFVQIFILGLTHRFSPSCRAWDKTAKLFKDAMVMYRPDCPLVEANYYWRGVLLHVMHVW